MFWASMSQACWSGTGDTYNGTLWFRWVANRSTWGVNHLTGLFEHLRMQWPYCLLDWIEGRPSHWGTLECAWLLELSGNDGTRSWFSTGEWTSLPSGFLLVCLCRLLLLIRLWQPTLFCFGTGPWTFLGPEKPSSTPEHLCVACSHCDHRPCRDLL